MHSERRDLNWETVERLDWHLWILAILLIFVLGVSLLGFMFPTAFWFGQEQPLESPQRAFVGFCVLLALVLVYLLQRQATVRRLKRQLFHAQAAVVAAEREAAVQTFLGLPGTSHFRDALAMEYRRASVSGDRVMASMGGTFAEDRLQQETKRKLNACVACVRICTRL